MMRRDKCRPGRVNVWKTGRELSAALPARHTLREVAALMGLSVQGVVNIETRALGKIALKMQEMEE
jgi:DNA-directed RNA polymerase sigma subunit (sigma70/sigma32)